jgi:hypothetical protein
MTPIPIPVVVCTLILDNRKEKGDSGNSAIEAMNLNAQGKRKGKKEGRRQAHDSTGCSKVASQGNGLNF